MNSRTHRYVLTGGAGFIGSHLTRQLCDAGASVDVVDSLFAGTEALVPDEAQLHEVDLRDGDALTTVVHDVNPDVVVHLAACHFIPYCNANPEPTFDVNVMGTRTLLNAARNLDDLDRVVFGSTAAVYPPREEAHHEADATGPMDIYGRTKLVGEDLTQLFHEETGVDAVSARLFNVYGPNETNDHLLPAILEQIADGTREIDLGNLTPKRDFVYVGDVARALQTLATVEEFDAGYRAYNVGTGEAYSVREVVEHVSEALGEEITIAQDDDRVRESDRPHLEADVSRIEDELGWSPAHSFTEGLERLLEAEGITE
jgi:UDP-glucose 4-epimerase